MLAFRYFVLRVERADVINLHQEKKGQSMKWFRPIIISVLTLTVVVALFLKFVDAEAFWVFATGLIVWWFKSRDEAKGKEKG